MKSGQQQQKTFRFKVVYCDDEGNPQSDKKYFNFEDVFSDTKIGRASFFKLCRGVAVAKYKNYQVTPIREPAYKLVRVNYD